MSTPPVTFPDALDPTHRFMALLRAHQQKKPPPPWPLQGGSAAGMAQKLNFPEWSRPLQQRVVDKLPAVSEDELLGVRARGLASWAMDFFHGGLMVLGPPTPGLLTDLCRMEASLLPHSFGARVWTGQRMDVDEAWRTGLAWADQVLGRDITLCAGINPDPVEGDLWLKNHLPMRFLFSELPSRYKEVIRQRAKEKAPVLLVVGMCDFKQFRVAPNVQLQVGGYGAVSDGEFLFGSKRLEDAASKYWRGGKSRFCPQAVPGAQPQTGHELTYGTPAAYARQCQELLNETQAPHLVVHLRHPDQWLDLNLAVGARAHALAGADADTLLITSGFVLPPGLGVVPGVIGVNLLRLATPTLHRLGQQLARHKLRFKEILLATPPVFGGVNFQATLDKWQSVLGAFGPVKVIGQSTRHYPHDVGFYARLGTVQKQLTRGPLGKPLTFGYREYMGIVRDITSGWPREDSF